MAGYRPAAAGFVWTVYRTMIVLTHDYTIDFTQFEWFNKMPSTGQIDSFGYSKSVALTIVGIATVFFFCYYYWKQTNKYHMTSTAFFANIDKKSPFF